MNFPHNQGRGDDHGGSKVVKYDPTADQYAPTASKEANRNFHIKSPWDPLQGVTEPEFFISSQVVGHMTPILG